MGKVEVIEIKFDPKLTSYEQLAKHAAGNHCAEPIFACNDSQSTIAKKFTRKVQKRGQTAIRWVKDNKYYMSRLALKYLPVTESQATRMNAGLKKAEHWLSPSQIALLKKIKANPKAGWPDAIGVPFHGAWKAAAKIVQNLN